LESGHEVAPALIFAVSGVDPAVTFTLTVPEQPMASVNVTVCGPAVTLINTLLACGVPPSSEYMYGAVPLVGVTVMVPVGESGHWVAVELILAVSGVLPAVTFTLMLPVQPMASVNVTVCGPAVTFVKTLLACGAPPSRR
jgi:hypothetical protein